MRSQLKVKLEMAKFLQETLEQMSLERNKEAAAQSASTATDFALFIKKVILRKKFGNSFFLPPMGARKASNLREKPL